MNTNILLVIVIVLLALIIFGFYKKLSIINEHLKDIEHDNIRHGMTIKTISDKIDCLKLIIDDVIETLDVAADEAKCAHKSAYANNTNIEITKGICRDIYDAIKDIPSKHRKLEELIRNVYSVTNGVYDNTVDNYPTIKEIHKVLSDFNKRVSVYLASKQKSTTKPVNASKKGVMYVPPTDGNKASDKK